MSAGSLTYQDTLYGQVSHPEPFSGLITAPVLQRLRHVRLSNIDSVAMPGIANISRYEHVLGVGYLAQRVTLTSEIGRVERIALGAAALLHDWAITAFGHLVEESFKYLGAGFDHEHRLYEMISRDESLGEVGFENRQILRGRQTSLRPWARGAVGETDADALLKQITDLVLGRGRLGPLISGSIDLDNIDNVYRIAFHMGLPVDRSLPLRLAEAIIGVNDSGDIVFARRAETDVATWLDTRREVYGRLMPAEPDFGLKIMIIYAAVEAQRIGELAAVDWHLTEVDFLQRLSNSSSSVVRDTINRWMTGEVWNTSPLRWMTGARPTHPELMDFSKAVSKALGRECLAYGIKDKRDREVHIEFDDGQSRTIGTDPDCWLLGVGSPKRQAFTAAEATTILDLVAEKFGGGAISDSTAREDELPMFASLRA